MRRILPWLLLVAVLGAPRHYRDDAHPPNESARVYAAEAIARHGTLDLSPVFDAYFPGWRASGHPPNADVSEREGVYLLDKAPGATLLAVPVVAVLDLLGLRLAFADLAWLLAVLLSAVPTAAFAALLHRRLARVAPPAVAAWVPAAAVLATPWAAYAGLLFGHALAASLLGAGALLALGPFEAGETGRGRREPFLGGLLLGLAVLVEYPVALPVALACLALALDPGRRRRLLPVILGGAGPAAVLLLWNTLAFGSPFASSYDFKVNARHAAVIATGLSGFGLPDAGRLYELVLGPERGLLFLAPWLGLSLPAAALLLARRTGPVAWRALPALAVVVLPVAVSGFVDWQAGMSMGPRHLVPAIPLLAIAVGLAAATLPAAGPAALAPAAAAGLVASSALACLAGAFVFPYFNAGVRNPLFEVIVPVLLRAGAGPTAWDALAPAPFAGLLLAGAAAVAVAVLAARAVPGFPAGRGRAVPLALAALLAAGHLAAATLPQTPGPGAECRLLEERAVVHKVIRQDEAAADLVRVLRARCAPSRHRD